MYVQAACVSTATAHHAAPNTRHEAVDIRIRRQNLVDALLIAAHRQKAGSLRHLCIHINLIGIDIGNKAFGDPPK